MPELIEADSRTFVSIPARETRERSPSHPLSGCSINATFNWSGEFLDLSILNPGRSIRHFDLIQVRSLIADHIRERLGPDHPIVRA